jgi:predicted small metal-binding protein
MTSIGCAEIGIDDCEYHTQGNDRIVLMAEMLQHLRRVHRFDIPNAVIREGERGIEREPERIIVARLKNRLELA